MALNKIYMHTNTCILTYPFLEKKNTVTGLKKNSNPLSSEPLIYSGVSVHNTVSVSIFKILALKESNNKYNKDDLDLCRYPSTKIDCSLLNNVCSKEAKTHGVNNKYSSSVTQS